MGVDGDRSGRGGLARVLRRARDCAAVEARLSRLLSRHARFLSADRENRRSARAPGSGARVRDPRDQGALSARETDLQPRLRNPAAGAYARVRRRVRIAIPWLESGATALYRGAAERSRLAARAGEDDSRAVSSAGRVDRLLRAR